MSKKITTTVSDEVAKRVLSYLASCDASFTVEFIDDSVKKPERHNFRGAGKPAREIVLDFVRAQPGQRASVKEIGEHLATFGFSKATASPAISATPELFYPERGVAGIKEPTA